MSLADRAADGAQAEMALERWLAPAFDAVTDSYNNRLKDIASREPWETDKIIKLAAALKIAGEVRKQIEAVVADGKVALSEIRQREQIENIPLRKRQLLGIL